MNVQVTRYEHADTHDPAAVVHLYGTDHPTRIGGSVPSSQRCGGGSVQD